MSQEIESQAESTAAPQPAAGSLIEQMPENRQRLDPNAVTVSRIVTALVSLLILAVPSAVGWFSDNQWLFYVGIGASLAFFAIGFIWARKSYDYTWYWLSEEGLYIQRGVLWRKKTLVPYNRVQHTDVSQGPLERKYQLGKLVVHTAGTRDASVPLEGILLDTAHQLRSVLQEEGESDAV